MWFYLGGVHDFIRGHAWFYSGGMVLFGGVRGFIWGGVRGFIRGACMVLFGEHVWFYSGGMVLFGGHAWFFQFFRIQ